MSKSITKDQVSSDQAKVAPSELSKTSNIQESTQVPKQMDSDQIGRLWEHGMHEDTIFNDRLNFFLVFESVLLGVVGMLYSKQPPVMKAILITIVCLGLFITIIWGYIQARQRSTLHRLIERLEEHLPEFRDTFEPLDQKKWRRLSGTLLLTYFIPLLVALIWVVLLVLFLKSSG